MAANKPEIPFAVGDAGSFQQSVQANADAWFNYLANLSRKFDEMRVFADSLVGEDQRAAAEQQRAD